ncbi:T9SS type B sorting domain-containing protein [Nonlabens sp. Asnod3-H03]|uniref:T9SS type B sorting domain-containing protein n=1 Tax=Nonlabens sp. Asnod3-H03 TaxID=3160580 RepID=UPI0038686A84
MKKQLILSLLCLFIFAFAKAQSVNTSYLCLANGDIVLADLGNCSSTVVASYSSSFFDIAQGDTDDTLYGIRNDELFLINVSNGAVTSLGILNVVGFTGNFRVDSLVKEGPGTLLGVHTNSPGGLFRFDIASMTATYIGDTGFPSAGDLTYFNGNLYLSADGNDLALIDVVNPSNSSLVGTIPGVSGFNNVFGVVTIITANPCAINPTFELVATGGNDTRFIDINTAQTTANCPNLVSSDIFGAAEVASDVICSISLDIEDSNGNTDPEYCQNANTILNTTANPLTPLGVYSYEWRIQGQAGVVGTSAILPINISATTTYECTITDSGRVAPDNIATSSITVTVNPIPSWNPIANVIAHGNYTLPAITGTNIPANAAFYDNPAHTGTPWNAGDVVDPSLFTTNPATIFVYGIDANGCELIEQFDIEFVDAQVTITPGGIQDVCDGDMVTLTATTVPATPYGNYSFNWSDTQGTSYPNTSSITVTVNVATTVSVTVNDSGVENGTDMGFDMTDFNVLPVIDIDDLVDQNVTGSFTFPAITGTGLTGAEAYYTQPNGNGIMYNPGDVVTAADFAVLPIALYIYDDNGSCSDEESFILGIMDPPMLSLTISATGNDFCAGESTTLTATVSPATAQGSYNYEWREQGATTVLSTAMSLTVMPAVTTVYECTVTDTGLTTNNSITETLTINLIPVPELNPIGSQIATGSYTFPSIGGNNLSGNQLFYTQPNGLGSSYATGDVIDITDFITYPVTLYAYDINASGCDDEISFELTINPVVVIPEPEEPLFVIPDYMTPNNDGYHDFWRIDINSADVTVTGIYIFDRYGKLLKQLAPDGIGWDATYNGNPLPSSTYWYQLKYEVNGVPTETTGFFAVKR